MIYKVTFNVGAEGVATRGNVPQKGHTRTILVQDATSRGDALFQAAEQLKGADVYAVKIDTMEAEILGSTRDALGVSS